MAFLFGRVIAACLLVWALQRHPYSYYILLRWVVCGVSTYGVYCTVEGKKKSFHWTVVWGLVAALFNPFFPVYLDRQTWAMIDLVVAGLFLSSIPLLQSSKETKILS